MGQVALRRSRGLVNLRRLPAEPYTHHLVLVPHSWTPLLLFASLVVKPLGVFQFFGDCGNVEWVWYQSKLLSCNLLFVLLVGDLPVTGKDDGLTILLYTHITKESICSIS